MTQNTPLPTLSHYERLTQNNLTIPHPFHRSLWFFYNFLRFFLVLDSFPQNSVIA